MGHIRLQVVKITGFAAKSKDCGFFITHSLRVASALLATCSGYMRISHQSIKRFNHIQISGPIQISVPFQISVPIQISTPIQIYTHIHSVMDMELCSICFSHIFWHCLPLSLYRCILKLFIPLPPCLLRITNVSFRQLHKMRKRAPLEQIMYESMWHQLIKRFRFLISKNCPSLLTRVKKRQAPSEQF